MKKLLFTISFLVLKFIGISQTERPPDQGNYTLQRIQQVTAGKFMKFLEDQKIDSAFSLLDHSFTSTHKGFKEKLKTNSKELQKYLATTKLSIVTVFPEYEYNTYRCRYWNSNGEFFYVDLYLKTGDPGSLIMKIMKVPEKKLIQERKELAKKRKLDKEDDEKPPLTPPAIGKPKSGNQNE